MTNDLQYKVSATKRGKTTESEPMTLDQAVIAGHAVAPSCKVVTILKEDDGSGHPDNKGKWFLHRIVK